MSFSVTCERCGLVWSSGSPFAQPRNAVRPSFVRFLWEIGRFLRTSPRALDAGDLDGITLGAFAEREGYSKGFLRHYLVPMAAALWSSGTRRATEMPARHVLGFFDNHGLLGLRRLRWKTVSGGSASYVDAMLARLPRAAQLGLGVRSIERGPDHVRVRDDRDLVHRFDAVVIATHADDALRLLADADPARARRAVRVPVHGQRDRAAHGPSGAAACAALVVLLERAPGRLPRPDDASVGDVLAQPAAAARRRAPVLRHAQSPRRRRREPGDQAHDVLASASSTTRPWRHSRSSRRSRGGVRSSPARTTATASTRTASLRACGRLPDWVRRGDAASLAACTRACSRTRGPTPPPQRIPPPGRGLQARPGRAPPARAPARPARRQARERRLSPRRATTSATRGGRSGTTSIAYLDEQAGRPRRRPGGARHDAQGARLRLQPGQLLLLSTTRRARSARSWRR